MGYSRNYIAPSEHVEVADNILNEIFSITKRLKIKTFLLYGTCLGFVRDGGYIQGDRDIDLGIICAWKEKVEILKKAFKKNGFTVRRSISKSRHVHFIKDKICLDIWFCNKCGEFCSKFDYIQYKKKKYPVPHPVGEFLNRCYPNWRVKESRYTNYFILKG